MFQVAGTEDLSLLLLGLRAFFPLSKPMWQVVRDTRDGLMEANLFTDEWPNFTTVISQEFVPRVSEVADLRIYTRRKENVISIVKEARLLENVGACTVSFLTEKEEPETLQYIIDALKQVVNKDSVFTTSTRPAYHFSESYNKLPVPPGYVIKDLQSRHAALVAGEWRDAFHALYPPELKVNLIRELILRFGAVGVFTEDNLSEPVGWNCRRKGGYHGMTFIKDEHRGKRLFPALYSELAVRSFSKGEVVLIYTNKGGRDVADKCKQFAVRHAIAIQGPQENEL